MTNTNETEDRRLRRKTAAFRLKHDVGKALRWSAPEEREKDAAALRERLASDLLPRASGGGSDRDVLRNFFEWKREEGTMFASGDPDLAVVERAMAAIAAARPALLLLEGISFSSLLSLDAECHHASRACTAFYRRVAVDEGPEVVRPFGRRGGGA
jgi:hypothetical protein